MRAIAPNGSDNKIEEKRVQRIEDIELKRELNEKRCEAMVGLAGAIIDLATNITKAVAAKRQTVNVYINSENPISDTRKLICGFEEIDDDDIIDVQ